MPTSIAAPPIRAQLRRDEPEARQIADWKIVEGHGPVIATAIHDGHCIRETLKPYLAIGDADRLREEDPLTSLLTSAADTSVHVRTSRFEFDVNRARDKAMSTDPADTWGLAIWNEDLPDAQRQISLARYDDFYRTMRTMLDRMLEKWGCLLLLDIHSYNHRRDGPTLPAAPQAENPDIDLGVTTLDAHRWGAVVQVLGESLAATRMAGCQLDVRSNVRYAGGGHFPEWVHSIYASKICTISLEYKKIFMDEWSGMADIASIDDLRCGLENAVAKVRGLLGGRR